MSFFGCSYSISFLLMSSDLVACLFLTHTGYSFEHPRLHVCLCMLAAPACGCWMQHCILLPSRASLHSAYGGLCLLAHLMVSVSLNTFSASSNAFHALMYASGW